MKTVRIETKNTGVNFGCYAIVRDAKTGRKLAETKVRPSRMDGVAYVDAESLAASRGWKLETEAE